MRTIKLEKGVGGALKPGKHYAWFPGLQIIVSIDTNAVYQLRKLDNGWNIRINRKNGWHLIAPRKGGPEFERLIEPHYVAYLNDIILGEADAAAQPERSGVQGGNGSQAG